MRKGQKMPEEQKRKIGKANKGKVHLDRRKPKKITYCSECGAKLCGQGKTGRCRKCAPKFNPAPTKKAIKKRAKSNRGHKRTKETCRNISESKTGKKRPDMEGENNHFYGKRQPKKTLKKIGKKLKNNWKDPKHTYNSKEFRDKRKEAVAKAPGKGNFKDLWKDPSFKEKMRKARAIVRHHKDADKKNNEADNFIWMLGGVHQSLHRKAYNYLVETDQIDEYLKWFKKKFKAKYYKRKPKTEEQ